MAARPRDPLMPRQPQYGGPAREPDKAKDEGGRFLGNRVAMSATAVAVVGIVLLVVLRVAGSGASADGPAAAPLPAVTTTAPPGTAPTSAAAGSPSASASVGAESGVDERGQAAARAVVETFMVGWSEPDPAKRAAALQPVAAPVAIEQVQDHPPAADLQRTGAVELIYASEGTAQFAERLTNGTQMVLVLMVDNGKWRVEDAQITPG